MLSFKQVAAQHIVRRFDVWLIAEQVPHDGFQRLASRFSSQKYWQTPCRDVCCDQKSASFFPATQSQTYLLDKRQLLVTVNHSNRQVYYVSVFVLRNKNVVLFPEFACERPLAVMQSQVIDIVFPTLKITYKFDQKSCLSSAMTTKNLRSIIGLSQR